MIAPPLTPTPQSAPLGGSVAVGYAYLNTAAHPSDACTLETQQDTIESFAQDHGLVLRQVIHETSESLSPQRQPRLERLLRGESDLDWGLLLVARLDRLTRHVRSLHAILSRLRGPEARHLVSIEEGIDTRTPSGQFSMNLVEIFAAWDSSTIPDRTKEWIARKRLKGEPIGHAPFGYTYENKQLVACPDELNVMHVIEGLRAQHLSYEKIARYLNSRNIPSKRGGGWYPETVKAVYSRCIALAGHPPK